MSRNKFLSGFINNLSRKLLGLEENPDTSLGNPQKFLIVRQHNQLGDLLVGVSVFRAIKETYPESHITLIASPVNYPGLIKNKYLDRIFIFDKKKIYNPFYLGKFIRILKEPYDVAVVPVVVSISYTSNLIARLSNSGIRIGPRSLDGKKNKSDFFFDRRVSIDWRKHPDSHAAERSLDIVRPFGINTSDYRSEITFDRYDIKEAENFILSLGRRGDEKLIGLHVGAAKIPNRWSLINYTSLIKKLNNVSPSRFYLTASAADTELINYIREKIPFNLGIFVNRKIPEVAALVSLSDLFISNDTGIMHVAGVTGTPQVSIFGPTNPFNWAPIGSNKFFIRKSDLIDDVSVDDVFNICSGIIKNGKKNFDS